jgi:hypothetical protein
MIEIPLSLVVMNDLYQLARHIYQADMGQLRTLRIVVGRKAPPIDSGSFVSVFGYLRARDVVVESWPGFLRDVDQRTITFRLVHNDLLGPAPTWLRPAKV